MCAYRVPGLAKHLASTMVPWSYYPTSQLPHETLKTQNSDLITPRLTSAQISQLVTPNLEISPYISQVCACMLSHV